MRRLWYAFAVAFVLNLIWEHAHSVLYLNYRGGEITSLLLMFMAVKDAVIITSLIALQQSSRILKGHPWFIPLAAFLIALFVEWHALATGRWAYAAMMPIIPLLGVGVSPILQMSLTSYLSYRVSLYTVPR